MADKTVFGRILDLIPQKDPFRFVDEILEVDEDHAVSSCRFGDDAWFYKGHFPGNPVTPGVILVETMAQAGLVVTAIYHDLAKGRSEEDIKRQVTLFTLADQVEFYRVVVPGTRVIARSETVFSRRGNVRCRVSLEHENGERICEGMLTGKGVNA